MKLRVRSAGMIASWVTMAAALLAAALPARADPASAPPAVAKRPKICLVLSGGGARGAAHVGVLKVLKEYRVPIDCIAGTSMGALVGGAYASGMSVVEMDELIAGITSERLFKENPPRKELSMRRKQDDYNVFFGPEVGLKDGKLALGKGLVTGVQLETVLRELSKAKGYFQFDELPIPFRAVATDLETGKAVIFSEGDLAQVMRASMSVPGAVAPAELNGRLLVDGMLTSNLPIQTARAMGADIIIAVNVGTPLLKREQLNGILGVTSQMLSILTEQNVQASLATLGPADILISPQLGDFSTSDFDHLAQIVPLGEVAARQVADRLALLSIPPVEYATLRSRQEIVAEPDLRPIVAIRFKKLDRVNPKAALSVMQTRPGEPIDQQTLDGDMRRLYGTGDFEHVSYEFLEEPGGRVLEVDAVEKSWGPDYLRFGLGLSSDFSGDAYFELLGSYRKTWMNSLGAEWRTDVEVGHTSLISSEFYQPVNGQGSLFVAPNVIVKRSEQELFQGDHRVARYNIVSGLVGADVGSQLRQLGELRLGVVRGVLKPNLDTGPESLSPGKSSVTEGAFKVSLNLDQLDSAHFPRSGWRSTVNVFKSSAELGAAQSYTKWDVVGNLVGSFGEHTINAYAEAGGKVGSNLLPRYDLFQWGGLMQQSGYAVGQLVGQNLKYGRVAYYRRILQGTWLEGLYAGFSLEAGEVGSPLVPGNPDGLLKSASIFVAVDSPVGPAYLGYGRAQDGTSNFYLYLGRPF